MARESNHLEFHSVNQGIFNIQKLDYFTQISNIRYTKNRELKHFIERIGTND